MPKNIRCNNQNKMWSSSFGKRWTDRNLRTPEELDKIFFQYYGISRTELNRRFIGRLNRNVKILEVGSNTGNQLLLLKKMGFKNLYGIEINSHAIRLSKKLGKGLNIIYGSAFNIPFKDGSFDLVFTSGLLIHIAPVNIRNALREIYRCSNRYIWGCEYYDKNYNRIEYRGFNSMLWKADFSRIYLDQFKDVKLKKKGKLEYKNNANIDVMFLLTKRGLGFNENNSRADRD